MLSFNSSEIFQSFIISRLNESTSRVIAKKLEETIVEKEFLEGKLESLVLTTFDTPPHE